MIEIEDFNKLKEDFDEVIRYSQNIPEPKTNRILEEWRKNKERFFHLFGDRLIYEYPKKVSFEIDDKEKHKRIVDFIDSTYDLWGCDELSQFIEYQKEGFFKNLTIEDFKTSSGKVIKKGSKLIKAFKYFVPEERKLIDIQNEASRIIQENKIEGTLCLSIHPLDFLSSSENTYKWRSCHSLDGDYRAGNISYMLDDCTVLCYLKGDLEDKLPNFPYDVLWNSKKWRMLLYFSSDNNMIFAGRQYPFDSKYGKNFVLKKLLKESGIISTGFTSEWSDWSSIKYKEFDIGGCKFKTAPYIPLGNGMIPLKDLVKDNYGSMHYNDILHSTCYNATYTFRYNPKNNKPYTSIEKTSFKVGGFTPCLRCGEHQVVEPGYNSMMCDSCSLRYADENEEIYSYCNCCGSRFFSDDGYFVENDFICPQCLEEEAMICECCGEYVYRDHIQFDNKTNMYLCEECFFNNDEKGD